MVLYFSFNFSCNTFDCSFSLQLPDPTCLPTHPTSCSFCLSNKQTNEQNGENAKKHKIKIDFKEKINKTQIYIKETKKPTEKQTNKTNHVVHVLVTNYLGARGLLQSCLLETTFLSPLKMRPCAHFLF